MYQSLLELADLLDGPGGLVGSLNDGLGAAYGRGLALCFDAAGAWVGPRTWERHDDVIYRSGPPQGRYLTAVSKVSKTHLSNTIEPAWTFPEATELLTVSHWERLAKGGTDEEGTCSVCGDAPLGCTATSRTSPATTFRGRCPRPGRRLARGRDPLDEVEDDLEPARERKAADPSFRVVFYESSNLAMIDVHPTNGGGR